MTCSIMLRVRPLLDLFPRVTRSGMLRKSLFAAAEFIAFPFRDGHLSGFLGDAVPKVFDVQRGRV